MGNQTWWDVITVKSPYTTHFVPMLSWRESDRQRNRRRRLSAGLLGRQGWLACQQAPELSGLGERALVIWSVRQLGLSSETQ